MELKVHNGAIKGRIVPIGAQRHIGEWRQTSTHS